MLLQHAYGLAWSTSGSRSPYMQVAPTLEAMSLRRGGIPNVLLAAGAGTASIISEHGNQLEVIHLPVRQLCRALCASLCRLCAFEGGLQRLLGLAQCILL